MANDMVFDFSEVYKGLDRLEDQVKLLQRKALREIAEEVLRLSSFEVPHDTGALQTSGHIEYEAESSSVFEAIVGYNKVYAARLHENPQYNFQKGRKGKYLEDPIKNNLSVFLKFFGETIASGF